MHDTETIARIRGIAAHMLSFEFFFGLVLGEIRLRHTDKALQGNYSAAEGQRVIEMTKKTLQSIRREETFELFWIKVTTMACDVDVDEATLPRKRKRPQCFEQGDAPVGKCTMKPLIYWCKLSIIGLIKRGTEPIAA